VVVELAVDGKKITSMKNYKINIPIAVLLVLLFIAYKNKKQDKQPIEVQQVVSVVDSVSVGEIVYENDTLSLSIIDSIDFFKAKALSKVPSEQDTIPYISDFSIAKEMLKGEVTFGGWNDSFKVDSNIVGESIAFIRFNNGDTINPNFLKYTWDAGFVRYYPSERILLMEGGHTSDFSIDLEKRLADVELVGNPAYIVGSPSGQYRLNGWFPGQECSEYFIQKKEGKRYVLLAKLPLSISDYGFDLCTLIDVFWKTDKELYFRNHFFGDVEDERMHFFKVLIK